jgi:hypothetical protein
MTTILVAVGDTHVNSTVGLVTPVCNLDDGGTYRSSKGQKWLWRNWLSFWEDVKKAAGKNEVWTVFNGDLVDVNGKHQQTQNISQNEADVFKMTLDTLEPALEVSERVFVIRGTAAHTKSSGAMEEAIAADIDAEMNGDNYSWWELLLECEGVLFDIRHHGPLGGLRHTAANALNRRATEFMMYYWEQKKKCPDVAIQSHNHRYASSSDEYPVKVYALPAWQLTTEFGHRINKILPADIGGAIFVCDKGNYNPIIKRYKPEGQRAWRLSRRKI